MTNTHWIAVLVFSLTAAIAQTASQTAYQGQSWVGLLVSASCDKGNKEPGDRSKSNRESDLTVNGRTTTPAVDESGTRGSSNALEQGAKPPTEKQTMPETGDVMAKSKSSTDPGWGPARKQAQSLGASCALDANATQFALLLPDGSMLQFHELANQAIAKQMPSIPTGAKIRKVFRVSVQGKVQNGKIALNSIRM
jgi:hypothetical protein